MNKKLAGIFAMCALLLTGCQGAKESSKEITPPDTGWGKTVDEVLADWNLDRDQVEIFSETNSAAAIAHVKNKRIELNPITKELLGELPMAPLE